MLSIVPIPAFHDNYIWAIVHPGNKKALIVDPGDAAPVFEYLEKHALTLAGILITHHHPDHIGGIDALFEHTKCPVYAPGYYKIPHTHQVMRDGDTLQFPDFDLKLHVLHVPGHTLDHIAYYNDASLFCGDTLFAGGCGRVFEGTMEQMYESLCTLKALPAHLKVYCAHEYTASNLVFAHKVEPHNIALTARINDVRIQREHNKPTLPSTIELERQTNPFLRCDQDSVKTRASLHAKSALPEDWQVFKSIRLWKDIS
jgi:hydroxyacylglutathione hydrolase